MLPHAHLLILWSDKRCPAMNKYHFDTPGFVVRHSRICRLSCVRLPEMLPQMMLMVAEGVSIHHLVSKRLEVICWPFQKRKSFSLARMVSQTLPIKYIQVLPSLVHRKKPSPFVLRAGKVLDHCGCRPMGSAAHLGGCEGISYCLV